MLTIKQVERIYEEGIIIRFVKRWQSSRQKGTFNPETLEVKVYLSSINSPEDRDTTILHELIHARDDITGRRSAGICSPSVENEAVQTYRRKPQVLDYVKQLYGIT